MEPNKMKQKRRKYLYAAVALGMTFLLNLSGCSRRFTNYPETAGTVAIVDSTEREAVRDENGENPDQPIDLDNLGEQQSAAESVFVPSSCFGRSRSTRLTQPRKKSNKEVE